MSLRSASRTALLADVGGTNTRVAISRDGLLDSASVRRFRNADFGDLGEVLNGFLAAGGATPDAAAIAVAGPVRDGRGELTNLNWAFNEDGLATETGIADVRVLNDLQAQGHALAVLAPEAMRTVLEGRGPAGAHASQLVVGIGTGFNAAPVHYHPGGRLIAPSECGHLSLPQDTEDARDLARWLEGQVGFASVEDALSGRGIEALYRFHSRGSGAPPLSSAEILAGTAHGDAVADASVAMFVRLMGSAVGNLALTHLPFGGIFLIGGMARAMVPFLDRFGFAGAFHAKGRFRGLLEEFRVSVVEDDASALAGCAAMLCAKPD